MNYMCKISAQVTEKNGKKGLEVHCSPKRLNFMSKKKLHYCVLKLLFLLALPGKVKLAFTLR